MSANVVRATKAAFDLIKRSEDEAGFLAGRCTRLRAYVCPAGVWTIGWGHTRGVTRGMRISAERADQLLLEDVLVVERELEAVTHGLVLTDWQWDALVSLCFNLAGGAPALPKKAPSLWNYLWLGRFEHAANEFLTINRGGGKVLMGLVRRRVEERALFLGRV